MAVPPVVSNRYLQVEQLRLPQLLQEDFELEADVALPDERTPKSEKRRSDFRLPHLGQGIPLSFPTPQSLSNSLPHALHLNS
jgi:hypothetical protein